MLVVVCPFILPNALQADRLSMLDDDPTRDINKLVDDVAGMVLLPLSLSISSFSNSLILFVTRHYLRGRRHYYRYFVDHFYRSQWVLYTAVPMLKLLSLLLYHLFLDLTIVEVVPLQLVFHSTDYEDRHHSHFHEYYCHHSYSSCHFYCYC